MDLSGYQIFIVLMAVVAHTAGAVAYISKIKNELSTRVAVLEAGHTLVTNDLHEIKKDIKELLAWVHTEQGGKK
jgi:hypothetical protein